jgi:PPOX class probable F420-dependent enzyme
MADSTFAAFGDHKYLSLETFKKSGEGVKTPVWFVLHDGVLYVYTEAASWKVKRIRNNSRVRVALCTMRGRVTGPWVDGAASIIEGDERRMADRLLDRKYFLKVIANWVTKFKSSHERAMIRIQPSAAPEVVPSKAGQYDHRTR